MDGQEYLNQIAAQARPVKQSKGGGSSLFGSPIFKVSVIGVVAFIIIAIIGAILGGSKGGPLTQSTKLLVHVNYTSQTVSGYQPLLKSSALRSSSASLSSVLSITSRDLYAYMTGYMGYNERAVDDVLLAEATAHQNEILSDLFYAKINGILDRIYAHKMAYEISLIMTEESSLYAAVDDEALRVIIDTSYNSLQNLYSQFNEFSETK